MVTETTKVDPIQIAENLVANGRMRKVREGKYEWITPPPDPKPLSELRNSEANYNATNFHNSNAKRKKVGNVTYLRATTSQISREHDLDELRLHFQTNYESTMQTDYHIGYLVALDIPLKNICAITQRSKDYIQVLKSSLRGKAIINEAREQYAKILHATQASFALRAQEFLEKLIEGKIQGASVGLRAYYANVALDRTFALSSRGDLHNNKLQLSPKEIENLKERLAEITLLAIRGEGK